MNIGNFHTCYYMFHLLRNEEHFTKIFQACKNVCKESKKTCSLKDVNKTERTIGFFSSVLFKDQIL